jgi:hypothetical protein
MFFTPVMQTVANERQETFERRAVESEEPIERHEDYQGAVWLV